LNQKGGDFSNYSLPETDLGKEKIQHKWNVKKKRQVQLKKKRREKKKKGDVIFNDG